MLKSTTIRCTPCGGKGRQLVTRKINVKVPPGVQNGSTVRVKEQGDYGKPPGNLMVETYVPRTKTQT
jgi:molecular chaperone DnaJ